MSDMDVAALRSILVIRMLTQVEQHVELKT
jgi:hypothetical protein